MNEEVYPPNWVLDRARCTLGLTFQALAEIVERDVKQVNQLDSENRHQRTFQIERNEDGLKETIQVQCFPDGKPGNLYNGGVTFVKTRTSIEVFALDKKFQMIPEWDNKNCVCLLQVNGDQLETWQVSRRALSSFFFDKP